MVSEEWMPGARPPRIFKHDDCQLQACSSNNLHHEIQNLLPLPFMS